MSLLLFLFIVKPSLSFIRWDSDRDLSDEKFPFLKIGLAKQEMGTEKSAIYNDAFSLDFMELNDFAFLTSD